MKQKAWSEFGWQIAGGVLALVVVALVIATGLLTVDDIKQGKKLQGVGVAGPCRAFGIDNEECQKQARRIFAACYIQREECREKYGLELVRVERTPNPSKSAQEFGPRGGEAQISPQKGSQQPGPRGGGGKAGKDTPTAEGGPGRSNGSPPSGTPGKGAVPSTVEAAGNAVGQVGGSAGKAVEGVGKTVDCAVRGDC